MIDSIRGEKVRGVRLEFRPEQLADDGNRILRSGIERRGPHDWTAVVPVSVGVV